MAEKLQKAVNLSLDDYIQEKGIVSSLRPKPDAPKERPGYFKRPLQSDIEEEDEEEDDADIMIFEDREGMQLDEELAGEDDLGDTPPPLIREFKPAEDHEPPASSAGGSKDTVNVTVNVVNNNSARSFVTEEKKRGIKHMPSQQWRLQRGNQGFKKHYEGASVHEIFDRNTSQLIESLGENAKYRDPEARNRINNGRFGRNSHNNNNNNNNRNRRFQNQYGKNPGMTASFNPSLERRNLQLQHQGGRNQMNQVTDLRSQLSGQNNAGPPFVNPWQQQQQQPPVMMAFADMVRNMGQGRFGNSFPNAMQGAPRFGAGNGAGLLPMMNPVGLSNMQPDDMNSAAKLLFEQVMAVNQNFGPKYDMKVQKEIHTLQDKQLLYNSAGVVTMDGAGIEDGKIKPVTTDLSMNMRFS